MARHLLLALAVGIAGAGTSLTEMAYRAEEALGLLALFKLRGPISSPPGVMVVGMDEASLARFRALPADPAAWPEPLARCQQRRGGLETLSLVASIDRLPRALHACLVDTLAEHRVAAIGYDVAFTDDPLRNPGSEQLAQAVAEHGRVVLLTRARRVWVPSGQGPEEARDQLARVHPTLARAAIAVAPFTLPRTGARYHQFWTRHPALSEPVQLPVRVLEAQALPILEALARDLGWPVSATRPAERAQALVAALLATDPAAWRARAAGPRERDLLEAIAFAHLGPDQHHLNLYGPPGTIAHLSLADLLLPPSGRPIADLAGSAVFIGPLDLRTTLAADSFPTVFSDPRGIDVAGVEIAATIYANLRDRQTLRVPSEIGRALLVLILGAAIALAALRGTVWGGAALALGLAAAYATLALLGFTGLRLWLPVVVPTLVVLPVALILVQLARYLGLARWLGIYTPRPVSAALLRGRDRPHGEQGAQEVTVMFTDIVGSTTLAEAMGVEAFNHRLNAHLTLITRLVEAERGDVLEFLGDGIMACWSGSRGGTDHAVRACRTALAIANALANDNRAREAAGEPPIRLRIGINTGEVVIGNVGAPERGTYTAIGDSANAAQRIEQLAKRSCRDMPTAAVLVGDRTRRAVGAAFEFESIGNMELRGRTRSESVHRLIGPETVGEIPEGRS